MVKLGMSSRLVTLGTNTMNMMEIETRRERSDNAVGGHELAWLTHLDDAYFHASTKCHFRAPSNMAHEEDGMIFLFNN